MSQMTSIAFAWVKVKLPAPRVIWKNPEFDQYRYVSGRRLKESSGKHAEPRAASAEDSNTDHTLSRTKPVVSPRNHSTADIHKQPRPARARKSLHAWRWVLSQNAFTLEGDRLN